MTFVLSHVITNQLYIRVCLLDADTSSQGLCHYG